ncbi:MAG: CPBP family intramembrane metalloprotease [Cyclobacteriaceae bacterium]|nr:CPBP family intramembrane metalloprotease [Cyclobacteriaceae bacterium]
MIGILIQLALSWIVLWVFERGNLSPLGLMPSRRRAFDFVVFFLVSAAFCASGFGLKMLIAKQQWVLNPAVTAGGLLEGARWTLVSVLFEELIFRGALFYVLMKKIGAHRAIWISGATFGVYHWFSQGSWGNPGAMAITFVITGAMGLVLAYGFAKTLSLYVPIAIHLGWNLVQQNVFSVGPIGNHLFVEVLPRPEVTISYAAFWFMQLFSLVGVLTVNYVLLRMKKSAS